MTIKFTTTLLGTLTQLEKITYHQFIIHDKEELRTLENTDELLEKYADGKCWVIDTLNKRYNTNFNQENWLNYKEDKVAWFVNETGSNCLNYSEFKIPAKFHLWLGDEGFVIGIEQLGKGFNSFEINKRIIKENKGAAFNFYRECKGVVFFDDKEEAKVVYLFVNLTK